MALAHWSPESMYGRHRYHPARRHGATYQWCHGAGSRLDLARFERVLWCCRRSLVLDRYDPGCQIGSASGASVEVSGHWRYARDSRRTRFGDIDPAGTADTTAGSFTRFRSRRG